MRDTAGSRTEHRTGASLGLASRGPRSVVSALAVAGTLVASSVAPTWGTDGFPGLASIDEAEMQSIVADIERAAALAATELEGFRSDRLQREVVLEQTGSDPAAIRDWVAQHTTWVPYLGVLRGADGVLMDRTGNSLDRALLLAALLDEAGYATRLGNATLSLDATASVVASSGPSVDDEVSAPSPESVPELADYLDAAERSSEALLGLVDPSADTEAALAAVSDAAADHWWVQAKVDGAWLDLDPAGLSIDGAPDVVAMEGDPDPLADLRHLVTIRVVAERTEDGQATTFVPLGYTHELGADDPLSSFKLEFTPAITDQIDDELDLEGMAEVISHWRPVLSGASGNVTGEWFTSDGRLEPPTTNLANENFGEATSALGGLGGDAPAATPDSVLTGVWIEYVTDGPGLDPRVERRDLLRAPDPKPADVSAALLGSTRILAQAARVHPDAFERMLLENAVDARSGLIALAHLAAGDDDERIQPSLRQMKLQPATLLALAMERLAWNPDQDQLFLGRPDVWSEHFDYRQTDEGLRRGYALDIVHNDIDVVPSAMDEAYQRRVHQGTLDTLVEHVLAEGSVAGNTWARFDAALSDGHAWPAVADVGSLETLAAGLDDTDLARVGDSISAGNVLVVDPELMDGAASWWQVDPASGRTLGIGHNGWGADLPETVGTYQVPATVQGAAAELLGEGVAVEASTLTGQGLRVFVSRVQGGTITVYEVLGDAVVAIYSLSTW